MDQRHLGPNKVAALLPYGAMAMQEDEKSTGKRMFVIIPICASLVTSRKTSSFSKQCEDPLIETILGHQDTRRSRLDCARVLSEARLCKSPHDFVSSAPASGAIKRSRPTDHAGHATTPDLDSCI